MLGRSATKKEGSAIMMLLCSHPSLSSSLFPHPRSFFPSVLPDHYAHSTQNASQSHASYEARAAGSAQSERIYPIQNGWHIHVGSIACTYRTWGWRLQVFFLLPMSLNSEIVCCDIYKYAKKASKHRFEKKRNYYYIKFCWFFIQSLTYISSSSVYIFEN